MTSSRPESAPVLPGLPVALLADRAALWRTLARGLSHDLANASQMLSLDAPSEAALSEARERLERCAHLLAAMGRSDEAVPPPCLAGEVVAAVDQAQRVQTGHPGVRFEIRMEPSLPALAIAPRDLEHALLGLVTNAKQSGARHVLLQVHGEAGGVAFRVQDDGPGVTAEVAERLFQPGFTTRGAPHLGFGLAVARALVERWGGALAPQNSERGACFVVHVPAFTGARGGAATRA